MTRSLSSLFLGCAMIVGAHSAAAAAAEPASGIQPPRRVRVVVLPDRVVVRERPYGEKAVRTRASAAASAASTITFDELTLREAWIYPTSPLAPLAGRMLALRSPGLVLAGDMIEDVQLSGTAAHLAPLEDGSYSYLPFAGSHDIAFNQVNAYSLAHDFVNNWFVRHGWDRGAAFIGVRIYTIPSSQVIGQYEGGYAALYPAVVNGVTRHTAKDADLVRHEVAHTVLIPSFPMNPSGDPDHYYAFHEGMADYYAAIAGPNRILGEYVVPGGMRDLTTTDTGNYHMSRFWLLKANPYEAGRILSGALLAIRGSMGERLDELVVAAADQPAPASLDGFADALRRADIEIHGGAHLGILDAAFAARGLQPGSPARVDYDGPWFVSAGVLGTYAADVFGGYGPFTFTWMASTDGGTTWRPVGSGELAQLAFAETSLLRCDATDQVGGVFSSVAFPVTVFPGEVPPPVSSVSIVGPAAVPYGTRTRYSLAPNSEVRSPANWSIIPNRYPPYAFTGDVVDVFSFLGGFTLRAAVVGVTGGEASAQLSVTVTQGQAFVDMLPESAANPVVAEEPAPVSQVRWVRPLHSRSEREMRADFGPATAAGDWRAQLYDVRGRLVASANGPRAAGLQRLWSLAAVPPGVYFVRIATPARTESFRTVVVP